jgi:CheY-like chemotaxis protein
MSTQRSRSQRQPRSPRRLAHRRPRAIDRDLVELQRLAMLGQLFAEGAQEINALLELACTYVQLEIHGRASPGESEGHLQTIFDLAMIARDAALTVLEFSWPMPPQGGQTTYAIETVLRLFERRLAENAKVTLTGMEALAPVAMPAGQLQLVLANIVRNALDAVQGVPDGQIRLTASQTPGWLALEIWNSGPHIPKPVMDRLFRGRVSTKPRGRNIGLGIATSSQLVRSAGGRLDAWNDPHGGVSFRICLPVIADPIETPPNPLALPAPQRPSPLAGISGGKSALAGRQILVVDDCEPVRDAVKTLLREMSGATVQTCASGEQALELVWSSRQFDAIVLDLHLPRLSSEQTFARLPAPVRDRVIFLTHDGLQRRTADFLAVSSQPTLYKPVRYAALIEAIQSVSTSCG